jgi:hypothetical protein
MPTKNTLRAVWVLGLALFAALLLYISFTARTPTPKPQPQDEFPAEQTTPPST